MWPGDKLCSSTPLQACTIPRQSTLRASARVDTDPQVCPGVLEGESKSGARGIAAWNYQGRSLGSRRGEADLMGMEPVGR